RFREDLYYRLQVFPISLPPLRARSADLAVLCATLLRNIGVSDPGAIEGPNLAKLSSHFWPGNVRELRNVLERALAHSGKQARFCDMTLELNEGAVSGKSLPAGTGFHELRDHTLANFERTFLVNLLRDHGGNVRSAARGSGIERTQLRRLLRKHGLL